MSTRIYSFRAPEGFVPEGMSTGEFVRGLRRKKGAVPVLPLVGVTISLLAIIGLLYAKKRGLKKQIDALVKALEKEKRL